MEARLRLRGLTEENVNSTSLLVGKRRIERKTNKERVTKKDRNGLKGRQKISGSGQKPNAMHDEAEAERKAESEAVKIQ